MSGERRRRRSGGGAEANPELFGSSRTILVWHREGAHCQRAAARPGWLLPSGGARKADSTAGERRLHRAEMGGQCAG